MQAVVHAVEPIARRHDMPERVALGQGDHFGHTRRAGSKVEEQKVVRRTLAAEGDVQFLALLFDGFRVVDESFPFADGRRVLHAGDLFHRLADIVAQLVLVDGDDHLDVRLLHAVDEVFFHQHMRRGDRDRADLGQRHQRRPILMAALQDDQHRISLADPAGEEEVRGLIRNAFDVRERKNSLVFGVVAPDEGALARLQPGVFVHDVVGVIEVVRYVQAEMIIKIVVIAESRPVRETAEKIHG